MMVNKVNEMEYRSKRMKIHVRKMKKNNTRVLRVCVRLCDSFEKATENGKKPLQRISTEN